MVARHLGGIHLIHMRMNRIQFECEESERTCAPIRPYIIWMHERHIIAGWLPFGQCNLYESSRILVFWCHIEICAFIRRKKATYDFFFYYNTINSWHLHFFFFCQAFVCVCVCGSQTKDQIQQSDHFTVPFCHIVPGEHEPGRSVHAMLYRTGFFFFPHDTGESISQQTYRK